MLSVAAGSSISVFLLNEAASLGESGSGSSTENPGELQLQDSAFSWLRNFRLSRPKSYRKRPGLILRDSSLKETAGTIVSVCIFTLPADCPRTSSCVLLGLQHFFFFLLI